MSCADGNAVEQAVKQYYGETLRSTKDLKTGSCCVPPSLKPRIKEAMKLIHEEVVMKNYGCGLPFPEALEGCNALDLGSGSGRDSFVLSKLVGTSGKVFGVDMTENMLEISRKYVTYHMEVFGYPEPNIEFKFGYLEDLAAAGVPKNFFDAIVSNCVITLCSDKKLVIQQALEALKVGGEFVVSDIYCNRRRDKESEFTDDEAWDGYKFVSGTFRIFKIDPEMLSHPAKVTYNGLMEDNEDKFEFGAGLTFKKGESVLVDKEISCILQTSRFKKYFQIEPIESGVDQEFYKIARKNPFETERAS
ncbi:unnamed protein product [Notodromas monacha]|uniref:Arsenite methyltransferase n=1 Tax=Notodromas monacha TaxID=399045 RepID=A0A7R9BF22_9CRUS|nr:unnamed protein product [Notodromas monacha]CAG0914185.1 unnamed protein product [Notodromas monacha]